MGKNIIDVSVFLFLDCRLGMENDNKFLVFFNIRRNVEMVI